MMLESVLKKTFLKLFLLVAIAAAVIFFGTGCSENASADSAAFVHYGYQGARPAKCDACE